MEFVARSPADVLAAPKGPPRSIEAEKSLLGAMILNNSIIAEVAETVSADAFFRPAHASIYSAIVDLYLKHRECDLVILKDELVRRGEFDRIEGGIEFLATLVETVPSAANGPSYAAIVKEKAILRSLVQACTSVLREVENGHEDADVLLDKAQALLFQTASKKTQTSTFDLEVLMKKAFAEIESYRNRNARLLGLSTGFHGLDDVTSGLQKSQLVILAGRPSMGKTSLAMRIAEHVAHEEKKPVLFFSLEMAGTQIAQQMATSHVKVDSHKLRTGMCSQVEYARLLEGAGQLSQAPIIIDESGELSPLELRARARRLKAERGIELVIVDYLQKMNARAEMKVRAGETRQLEISLIATSLKTLAKELEVPVLALAQLNRSPEGREDRRPVLSDLRESGAIEQEADQVMLLYREDYYNPETDRKNLCDVIVAKNRTGPTETVELVFLKEFARFENPSRLEGSEGQGRSLL